MKLRRAIIGLAVALGVLSAPAIAQSPYPAGPPAPVPALPDSARLTTYTITGTTCACAVGFQLYGDGTDYQNWIEVWLNGVPVAYNDAGHGWTITSATGQLSTIPRPITDAVLTFNGIQTGTVQIVGSRRPRRTAQFSENRGVAARDLNQAFTDIIATQRETWDRTNDITGRGLFFAPGNVVGLMPSPSSCQNSYLGFDGTGLVPLCGKPVPAGTISTPGSTTSGALTIWTSTDGLHLGQTTALPNGTTATTQTLGDNTIAVATTAFVTAAVNAPARPVVSTSTTSKTASYTVLNADNHSTIYLTGAAGNQSIAVSALSSYTDPAFSVQLCNKSTHRWTITSADAGSMPLWPGQCNTLQSTGSALTYALPQQRFGATTVKVGPSGSCNNANDGLTADSVGQLCSFNSAFFLIQTSFDTRGSIGEVDVAAGAYAENAFFAGYVVGGGDQISILAMGDITNTVSSGTAFGVRDGGVLTLAANGHVFQIGCASATAVQATQFATLDTQSVQIATCSTPFAASDHGHINISGTTTFVTTIPVNVFTASQGGLITLAGTVTGSFSATNTMVVVSSGIIAYEGGAVTWTPTGGGFTATDKYTVSTGGGLNTGGNLAAIPGTGTSVTTPGWAS